MSTFFKNEIKNITSKVSSRSFEKINSHIDYDFKVYSNKCIDAKSNLVNFCKTLGRIVGSISDYKADTYAEKCFFAGSRLFISSIQLFSSLTLGISPYLENGSFEVEKSDLGFVGSYRAGYNLGVNMFHPFLDTKTKTKNILVSASNFVVLNLLMHVSVCLCSALMVAGLSIMAMSLAVVLPIEKICEKIKAKGYEEGYKKGKEDAYSNIAFNR
jgi:hypothetical protein